MDAFLLLLRWLHLLCAFAWLGLLYYFNLVQAPFLAEADAGLRLGVLQKLLPRALWWFRWAAVGTVAAGLAYLVIWWRSLSWSFTSWTVAILTGGGMGLLMFANVWLVLGPAQRVVIASAATVAAGGKPDPAAAAAARRSAVVSRTNLSFSIPLLFFMGSASHYSLFADQPAVRRLVVWAALSVAAVAALELNSLCGEGGAIEQPFASNGRAAAVGVILWFVLLVVIKGVL